METTKIGMFPEMTSVHLVTRNAIYTLKTMKRYWFLTPFTLHTCGYCYLVLLYIHISYTYSDSILNGVWYCNNPTCGYLLALQSIDPNLLHVNLSQSYIYVIGAHGVFRTHPHHLTILPHDKLSPIELQIN